MLYDYEEILKLCKDGCSRECNERVIPKEFYIGNKTIQMWKSISF